MICKHNNTKPCPRCLASDTAWSGHKLDKNTRELRVHVGNRNFHLFEGGHPTTKWGFWLWPSSVALAREVSNRSWDGLSLLEIGAGLGLPGMVAGSLGAQVTFCDHDTGFALEAGLDCNNVNGSVVHLDWKNLTDKWDSIIGSEMLKYGPTAEILELVDRLWTRHGPLLFTDHGSGDAVIQAMNHKWPLITCREVSGKMADGREFLCDLWTVEPEKGANYDVEKLLGCHQNL